MKAGTVFISFSAVFLTLRTLPGSWQLSNKEWLKKKVKNQWMTFTDNLEHLLEILSWNLTPWLCLLVFGWNVGPWPLFTAAEKLQLEHLYYRVEEADGLWCTWSWITIVFCKYLNRKLPLTIIGDPGTSFFIKDLVPWCGLSSNKALVNCSATAMATLGQDNPRTSMLTKPTLACKHYTIISIFSLPMQAVPLKEKNAHWKFSHS